MRRGRRNLREQLSACHELTQYDIRTCILERVLNQWLVLGVCERGEGGEAGVWTICVPKRTVEHRLGLLDNFGKIRRAVPLGIADDGANVLEDLDEPPLDMLAHRPRQAPG